MLGKSERHHQVGTRKIGLSDVPDTEFRRDARLAQTGTRDFQAVFCDIKTAIAVLRPELVQLLKHGPRSATQFEDVQSALLIRSVEQGSKKATPLALERQSRSDARATAGRVRRPELVPRFCGRQVVVFAQWDISLFRRMPARLSRVVLSRCSHT